MNIDFDKIWNDLVAMYGDKLPNPEQCPREFAHLLKLYMYFNYKEQQ